jgi:site-specific recombinase XerD
MEFSNHRIVIAEDMSGAVCQARCTCNARSQVSSRGDIEEWMIWHRRQVEIAKASLSRRNQSLKTTYAWFREQEANADNPAEDRLVWKRLADEVDGFVSSKAMPSPGEQLTLW